jgi:hypothetical protein
MAIGVLFILGLTGSIPGLGEYLPGQLLTWGGGQIVGTSEASWPALWISIIIIVVALMGASIIFERQEL